MAFFWKIVARVRDYSGALLGSGFFADAKKAGTESPTRPCEARSNREGHAQKISKLTK